MSFLYKTTRMYFSFIIALILVIVICFFLAPAQTTKKKAVNNTASGTVQSVNQSIQSQNESISTTGQIIYGKSGLGANLICTKISPVVTAKSKILMTFEIHGFEDLHPKDGQALVDIGNMVANYFMNDRAQLSGTQLYIAPSLNPDGLSQGYTNNGIGRCQASLGIDINRDFDYQFKVFNEARNHTLGKPFSSSESQALRDLVNTIKPDVVIDCHGWYNKFIGDEWVANCFKNSLNIYTHESFSDFNNGYFSAWAGTQGSKAMLLEYPPAAYSDSRAYADKTVNGIKQLITELNITKTS